MPCSRPRRLIGSLSSHSSFIRPSRTQRLRFSTQHHFYPSGHGFRYGLHGAQLRCASTTAAVAASTPQAKDARSFPTRLKNLFLGTTIGFALILGYYYVTDTRASIHEWLVIPCLRYFYPDAEDAHEFGNRALKALYSFGVHPRERGNPDAKGDLAIEVFGHVLQNPIGTSAGIDKHCDIPDALLAAGPAVVEIGGATPLPQEGNPKPRVWRIPSQKALINRYGLNSEGADHVAMRLRQRVREFAYHMGFGIDEEAEQSILDGKAGVPPGSLQPGKYLAVQVAKNKWTADEDIEAVKKDYVYCVDALARYADIVVVNVSSPNTPGLRGLQKMEPLTDILTAVVGAARKAKRKTPPKVMVKVSPDEDNEEDVRGICDAVWDSGVDGVVVGNTTKTRPDPLPKGYNLPAHEQRLMLEQGGYSGPQTFERTVALVKRYRKLLDGGSYPSPEKEEESPPSSSTSPTTAAEPPTTLFPAASPLETPEATHPPTTDKEIEESVARDAQRLKQETPEAEAESKAQSIIRIPERNNPFSASHTSVDTPPPPPNTEHSAASSPTDTTTSPSPPPQTDHHPAASSSPTPPTPSIPSRSSSRERKIIFATGGITTGAQALEVLAAGADVAQIYTALVYGGIGTVSKIKEEMRAELKRRQRQGR
ncbi:MAG: hypothetical protein L6R39_001553 [Caloplaca ligustica]|nr:MAG: hypothetical protein L6R39_001553 [Caloplaca ligustica]